jgi:hypothetical protein
MQRWIVASVRVVPSVRVVTWCCAIAGLLSGVDGARLAHAVAPISERSSAGASASVSTRMLLHKLTVGPTYHSGYQRSKFALWSAHPDGCDTREKVLIRDAVTAPRVAAGCALSGGRWRSPYDGVTTGNPSKIQVDHMVALAAAWGAGAWRWTPATREAFANDLGTHYDLLAVSAGSNESKGDSSPDRWLPPKRSFICRYVADYTAVLWRWRLAVNPTQKSFLVHRLRSCGWPKIAAPTRPAIDRRPTGGGGGGRRGQVATGIRISAVSFDSPGDDTGSNRSLNDEWVQITNTSSKDAVLDHWAVHDAHGSHRYDVGSFRLRSKRSVRLHTGRGADSATDLYWGSGQYIWNNDGDTATLLASDGAVADRCHFTAAGSPASC